MSQTFRLKEGLPGLLPSFMELVFGVFRLELSDPTFLGTGLSFTQEMAPRPLPVCLFLVHAGVQPLLSLDLFGSNHLRVVVFLKPFGFKRCIGALQELMGVTPNCEPGRGFL